MDKSALYRCIFALIEELSGMELSDTSRHLIAAYFQDAEGASTAEKARAAVERYVQDKLPTLAEIRERGKAGALTPLDHLVLQMEHEASRLR